VPIKRRNEAKLRRTSRSNGTKNHFKLNVKIALSALGALGTCLVDVGTPLFAWGGYMLRL
jgi:hypothetical protein